MKKLFLFAIAVLLVCGCTDSGIDETPYGGSDNTCLLYTSDAADE